MPTFRTCVDCKKKKDYGIWVTATDKPILYCLDCYLKKVQREEEENANKLQTRSSR